MDMRVGDEKPLEAYVRGDVLPGGATIDYIFEVNPDYMIARKADGDIFFKKRSQLPPEMRRAETLFLKWQNEGTHILAGAYTWEFNRRLANCLTTALKGQPDEIEPAFLPAQKFLAEKGPITRIFGSGPGFRVFQAKDGRVDWGHRDSNDRIAALASEYNSLYQIGSVRLQKSDRAALTELLGGDLVAAFRAADSKAEPSFFFRASRDFVERRVEALFRSRYVMASICAFLALTACVLYLVANHGFGPDPTGMNPHRILAGGFAGMVGALVSVIQRGNNLTLSPFSSLSHVLFQGVIRIFLGLLFGMLAVVAIDADLVLGVLKDNVFSVALLCVAAGASERFVPDLLDRLSEQAARQPKEPKVALPTATQ